MIREMTRPSQRRYVALLVTFFLLASLGAHSFNANSFVHKLDHDRHELSAVSNHSHFIASHEPSEAPPMDGRQHLALHSMGDIQPIVISAFEHPLVTPVTSTTPQSYATVAPGPPDRDPPFRPPQSA